MGPFLQAAFWCLLGVGIGFLSSMVANYPGNAVDRMWASAFNCEQRFIGIARQSVEYRASGGWSEEALLRFSDEASKYSKFCGRVGSFDMHQAVSSVDRQIRSVRRKSDENFDERFCFGEMIVLMKTDVRDWPSHFENHRANLSFCETREKKSWSWLGVLRNP